MLPDATPSPLSVGAVIQLRRRLWGVDQVGDLTFSATPLDGRDPRRWTFHRDFERPTPARVDDPRPDQLGQDPAAQDLYLRALRLRMIHAGAPFLGLQRSRATPQPYQLVPLLMALQLDRVRLLIGDDVGVGKTIEAGLILAELLARGQASRVLVVVPAALRDQWQDTLDRFFHVDAEIIRVVTRAGALGTVLVCCAACPDLDTGEYTVKDAEAVVEQDVDGSEHVIEVRLIPTNRSWGRPWSIRPDDGMEYRILASLVRVLE